MYFWANIASCITLAALYLEAHGHYSSPNSKGVMVVFSDLSDAANSAKALFLLSQH